MSKLEQTNILGELWLRNPSGKIIPSQDALSAIYLKYSILDSPIYFDLKYNAIKRFDFFYDVVFIETKNGFIFDKINFESNAIKPTDSDNRFISTNNCNKSPDYWFDEVNRKIYVTYNSIVFNPIYRTAVITVVVYQFDIVKNIYSSKLSYDIILNFCNNYYYSEEMSSEMLCELLEPPKMSYNKDTRCFDISFILRGLNREFGLINTILKKSDTLNIDSINCLTPYSDLNSITVNMNYNKTLETDFYD
jgi:hypothetical protein